MLEGGGLLIFLFWQGLAEEILLYCYYFISLIKFIKAF